MNKINWKVDILSTDIFKIERPHMSAFEDSNIQSAINTSLALLNAECNGLIEETWSVIDTDSPLFRTEREKSYIREAVISQTQFSLNMGLDMTDGSSSFSMGGINTSFQRPIEKKEVAPGVYILLQKARVYKLQSFTNNFVKSDTPIEECNVNKYLTPGQAEISYVKYDQSGTGAPIGGVLVVDNDKRATFKNPKEVEINSYNSLRIWDNGYGGTPNNPEDTVGSYKFINDVTNLAWFGDNTTNTLTRLQVQNLILASTLVWNAEIPYAKGTVIQYLYVSTEGQKLLGSAVSKVSDNLGNNPANDNGEHWDNLGTQPIDLDFVVSEVIKALTDRNTPNGKSKLDKVVEEKLNELPTIDYVSEYKKPILSFENEEDFSAYKSETRTTDTDYETVDILIDYYTKEETDALLDKKQEKTKIKVFFAKGEIKMFDDYISYLNFKEKFSLTNLDVRDLSGDINDTFVFANWYGDGSNTSYGFRAGESLTINDLTAFSHYHSYEYFTYDNLQAWNFGSGGQVWNGVSGRESPSRTTNLGTPNGNKRFDQKIQQYRVFSIRFEKDIVREIEI